MGHPSINCGISSYKSHSGRPGRATLSRTVGFHDALDMCTTSAKAVRTKSSRYGAKFELMRKRLQQDVTIQGITEQEESRASQAEVADKA
jgi:hypothetical protein